MKLLVALGGNAMSGPGGESTPDVQIAAATEAMAAVADLVVAGHDVLLTHGNGPQVGDLLVQNELAAASVPPVPLDWCVAETQATIGTVLLNALDAALAARSAIRPIAVVVTRALVDDSDPHFSDPTKPIGRYVGADAAAALAAHGQVFGEFGTRGWRRLVASPEPLEILDAQAIRALIAAGFIVVANGGGGVPTVRGVDGVLQGIEAVIDKDLGAALLARDAEVDRLVIATDVEHAVLGLDTPDARPLGRIGVAEMRRHLTEGSFGAGSMAPKVEAVCRFVEATGQLGVITSLAQIAAGAAGEAGTIVLPGLAD